jgi:hypothetical protein
MARSPGEQRLRPTPSANSCCNVITFSGLELSNGLPVSEYQKNLDTILGIMIIAFLRYNTLERINFVGNNDMCNIAISLRIGLEDLRVSLYQIGLHT